LTVDGLLKQSIFYNTVIEWRSLTNGELANENGAAASGLRIYGTTVKYVTASVAPMVSPSRNEFQNFPSAETEIICEQIIEIFSTIIFRTQDFPNNDSNIQLFSTGQINYSITVVRFSNEITLYPLI
jgi:hypothetical protein